MPFESGDNWKGNKEGRPSGATSERSKAWEKLKESILNTHTDRFNTILTDLDDKDFTETYLKVLQYFKPRMQHSKVEDITPTTEPVDLTHKQIDKLLEAL